MKKNVYKINGMNCDSCAKMIELDLEDAGIIASCSYSKEILEIKDDHDVLKLKEIITKTGYTLIDD